MDIIEEMSVARGGNSVLQTGSCSNRTTYRYVTPRELRIKTLCLFFLTSFPFSGLLPLIFTSDLYTATILLPLNSFICNEDI